MSPGPVAASTLQRSWPVFPNHSAAPATDYLILLVSIDSGKRSRASHSLVHSEYIGWVVTLFDAQ